MSNYKSMFGGDGVTGYYGIEINPKLKASAKKALWLEMKQAGITVKEKRDFKSKEAAEKKLNEKKFEPFRKQLEIYDYCYL